MAASLTLIALAGFLLWRAKQPSFYESRVGERRTIALGDGSTVALDARSMMNVLYNYDGRRVVLLRGQARFDVTNDPKRLFSVFAGGQRVVAEGASFDIELRGKNVLITAILGSLLIYDRDFSPAPRKGLQLQPGDQLVASTREGNGQVHKVDVAVTMSWQRGELHADGEPLADVLDRLNRYSPKPLSVMNTPTAQMLVSAVFDTRHPESFVAALTQVLPLRAMPAGNGGVRFARE